MQDIQEEKYFKEAKRESFQEANKEIFEERKEDFLKKQELEKPEISKEYPERRFVSSVEKITSSLSSNQFNAFQSPDLLEEDKKLVDSLVAVVIKNPDLQKGLDEANKILNKEARNRNIKQDSEFAYLIDAFHDELIRKLREREAG